LLSACGSQQLSTTAPDVRVTGPTGITSVGTCPATLSTEHFKYPDAPSTVLVPANPANATACRYDGQDDPHPGRMVKSATLNAADATRLATAFDAAPVWPPNASYNCPIDVGRYDIVSFGYSNRGPVDVLVDAGGCGGARNGHRSVKGSDTAYAQVVALVGEAAPLRH
jgi:hypothetical protein